MLFLTHSGLMVTGFLLMVAGVIIARYQKKKRWWLKTHKILEISAVLAVTVAFFCGIWMVSLSGDPHFAIRHAYVGLAVFVLSAITLVIGLLQLRVRGMAARLRPVHRWMGRTTILLFFLNIFLGLSLAGIW
jgi:amino acid transporter